MAEKRNEVVELIPLNFKVEKSLDEEMGVLVRAIQNVKGVSQKEYSKTSFIREAIAEKIDRESPSYHSIIKAIRKTRKEVETNGTAKRDRVQQ